MPYCEKCGSEYKNGDRFCEKCGSKIIKIKQSAHKKRKLSPKLILFVFLLSLFVGLYKFFFTFDREIGAIQHYVLEIDTSRLPTRVSREDVTKDVAKIILNRLKKSGVRKVLVSCLGVEHIIVQLSTNIDKQKILSLITKGGALVFKLVSSDKDLLNKALSNSAPINYELKYLKDEPLLLVKEPIMIPSRPLSSSLRIDKSRDEPMVYLKFNAPDTKRLSEITWENLGKRLAMMLDGDILAAPLIKERILNGECAIYKDRLNSQEAENLAIILNTCPLPANINIVEEHILSGKTNFSFKKGYFLELSSEEPLNSQSISVAIQQNIGICPVIQQLSGKEFFVWLDTGQEVSSRLSNILKNIFPDAKIKVLKWETATTAY